MRRFKWFLASAVVLAVASVMTSAQGAADHFWAASERFGYVGTVSVYDTFADANSGRNARCSDLAWPQRDGSLFAVKNAPEYYADYNALLTYWWNGNPGNTNHGFLQLSDDNADAWQNQKGSWSDDLSTFTVSARGRNATYLSNAEPMDWARLWNACAPAGSGEATKGTFLNYEYQLEATGLNGVEDETGFITNSTDASDYGGYFRGIFLNESATSPASNGYYVFDLEFNNVSWAVANVASEDSWPDEFGGRRSR